MCVCTVDGNMFELQTALLSISVYLEKKILSSEPEVVGIYKGYRPQELWKTASGGEGATWFQLCPDVCVQK